MANRDYVYSLLFLTISIAKIESLPFFSFFSHCLYATDRTRTLSHLNEHVMRLLKVRSAG